MQEGGACGAEKEHNLAREDGCIERIQGILSLLYNWSQDFPSSYALQMGKPLRVPLPKAPLSSILTGLASGFLNPCHFYEYDNYHILPSEWAFSNAENVFSQEEKKWIRHD